MATGALEEAAARAASPSISGGLPERKPASLVQLIERQVGEVKRALPKHISVERFTRIVLTAVKTTPKLLDCTPESVLGGMMVAAQLGVELNTPAQEAWILPFNNKVKDASGRETWRMEAQFILGYRGIIKLGYQSGQISSIVARSVYRGDRFEFSYGLEDKLIHEPNFEEQGEPYAWYAVAKFANGGYNFVVIGKAEVDRHREKSKAKDGKAWKDDYDAMARKTAIRIMQHYIPQSPELVRSAGYDESVIDIGEVLSMDALSAREPDAIETTSRTVDQETGEIK